MDDVENAVTDYWRTSISDISPGVIRMHGYPIEDLIGEVGFAEMVWLMLRGELPEPGRAKLLQAALVSSVDHGPQAPSIAAARMAVTCGLPLNGALATGANLLDDVHGGAGQQFMEFMVHVCERAGAGQCLESAVTQELDAHRQRNRFVPGFGHRFHPRDPRRDPLLGLVSAAAESGVVEGRYLAVALEVERQLSERRSRPVPMNIDGATATIYAELGFAPEMCRGLFVLSRSVGILAHAWEEHQNGRRLKGPLPPPLVARYAGPPRRNLPTRPGDPP